MAFTTFQTSHLCDGQFLYTIFFRKLFVYFSIVFVILDFNIGFFVTIDTPTHCQWGELRHYFHGFNWPMACLAFDTAHCYVLRVIEISKIWQVMNANPFYWLLRSGIALTIPSDGVV